MASLLPFRAIHYQPGRLQDAASVLDEPHRWLEAARRRPDREPGEAADAAPEVPGPDGATHHVSQLYRDWNGSRLARWLQEGYLASFPEETLYVYRQTRPVPPELRLDPRLPEQATWTGFVGVLEGATPAGVRLAEVMGEDRWQALSAVLRAFACEFSPVAALFGPRGAGFAKAVELLQQATQRPPDLELSGPGESRHQLWALDPQAAQAARDSLASVPVAVVEGGEWWRAALGTPAGILAVVCPAQGEGLAPLLLPVHRLLAGSYGLDDRAVAERASRFFRLLGPAAPEVPAAMAELGKMAGEFNGFVLYRSGGRVELVRSKGRMFMESWTHPLGRAAWRSLEVNILHALLLERALGIPVETSRLGRAPVMLESDPRRAMERVEEGDAVAAFLLPALSPLAVWQAAVDNNPLPAGALRVWPPPGVGVVLRRRR